MESQNPPLIDTEQLDTFIDLGLADFTDILGDVISDLPNILDKLQNAIAQGNEPVVRSTAHSARGMLATFGCTAMTHALHQVEHGASIPAAHAAAVRAELDRLWNLTLAAIQNWQQSAPFAD